MIETIQYRVMYRIRHVTVRYRPTDWYGLYRYGIRDSYKTFKFAYADKNSTVLPAPRRVSLNSQTLNTVMVY
jgi:hypothetical protein